MRRTACDRCRIIIDRNGCGRWFVGRASAIAHTISSGRWRIGYVRLCWTLKEKDFFNAESNFSAISSGGNVASKGCVYQFWAREHHTSGIRTSNEFVRGRKVENLKTKENDRYTWSDLSEIFRVVVVHRADTQRHREKSARSLERKKNELQSANDFFFAANWSKKEK